MLPIQEKILFHTGNIFIIRKKIHIINYIYDDIIELMNQGITIPAIQKIISNDDTKFTISHKLLKLYMARIKKSRKSENNKNTQTKINNDWSRVGLIYKPLTDHLEKTGYCVEDVINWGCKGETEVMKKLIDLKK